MDINSANCYVDKLYSKYYLDNDMANHLIKNLPDYKMITIKTLEIANSSGILTQKIINKYQNSCKFIQATILVSSHEKARACKAIFDQFFNHRNGIKIEIIVGNFLELNIDDFHIITGIPPIDKITGPDRQKLSIEYKDHLASSAVIFFTHKALLKCKTVSFVMPKSFLHNDEYSIIRKKISRLNILTIIDLGESAFKDVFYEFIAITINTEDSPSKTKVISTTSKSISLQTQETITSDQFPVWLIYRNAFFNNIADNMIFDCFDSYRDRSISSSILKESGEIPILTSKNLPSSNTIISTVNDSFIDLLDIKNSKILSYLNDENIYICPNMTVKIRLAKKPLNTLPNGSLAILKPKVPISEDDLLYFSSNEFCEFYKIARNYSKRFLNLDKNAVFFLGKIKSKI